MSALTTFFFRAPYSAPRTGEIVRWWEERRPAYNLAVGTAGVVSLLAVWVNSLLPPAIHNGPIPLGLILVYGTLANLFYCLGPLADTIIMRKYGRDMSEVGPMLFRYGFAFSVGLTLLPVPMSIIGYIGRLISTLIT